MIDPILVRRHAHTLWYDGKVKEAIVLFRMIAFNNRYATYVLAYDLGRRYLTPKEIKFWRDHYREI